MHENRLDPVFYVGQQQRVKKRNPKTKIIHVA